MGFGLVICVFYFIIQLSEQCLQSSSGNGPPMFQGYGGGHHRIMLHQQAIISSYNFTCYGVITEWGVDVNPGGSDRNGEYTIDFQVWRPSPTTPQDDTLGSGYYSLVGNNRFSTISLSNGVAQVTPSPQDYIQFRPGDVLGFYVQEASRSIDGVVALTTGSNTSEVVWYASVDSQNVGGCVSAGSNGNINTLLRGAPVISIGSSTSSVSSSMPQPTFVLLPPTPPDQPGIDESTITTLSESRGATSIINGRFVYIVVAVVLATVVIMTTIIISILVGLWVYKRRNKKVRTSTVQKSEGAAYGVTLPGHDEDRINTKQNESYAMSITIKKNEAYKPVANVSGECDEYDYIIK